MYLKPKARKKSALTEQLKSVQSKQRLKKVAKPLKIVREEQILRQFEVGKPKINTSKTQRRRNSSQALHRTLRLSHKEY